MNKWLRRVAIATVMAGTTLTGTLGAAAPAHANRCFYDSGWYLENGLLRGYAQRECVNPETVTGMPVVFERWEYSHTAPGDDRYARWVVVVSTRCNGSYTCRGPGATRWKFNGTEIGLLACS